MDSQENSGRRSNNISSEDILKALDTFGERTQGQPQTDNHQAKALNRDSGLSESTSSFFSDRPLSINSDVPSTLSESEHLLEFQSDGTFSGISDPLGACSSPCTTDGEEDNEVHYFETKPWDEKQKLEREWELLFGSDNFFVELSQHALGGKLRNSKFRSIAWKLFLDCLPENQKEWTSKTIQLRQEYETFKQKNLIDPTKSKEDAESLDVLHPLSLDESSPWKKFFKDNELKAVIKQDLDRLYPEIEFFCCSKVKEMMLNLLFCYAKKNEDLGYKQGMHELLAPIVYVLENDSKSHRYVEGDTLGNTVGCLMDPAYVEHDAFAMFCQLMEVTEAWYQHHNKTENYNPHNNKFVGNSEPFAEPVTSPPTAIVKKLNKIQDHLLRKHDTDLWFHLKELNVAPQVYGLRWIRLLFSREFPFQDVLVIWDALFAEGSHLDLVEYFFIVMLQAIRNKLMTGNYTTCMSYLMKFPHAHDDVHVYVKRAINLRGTKKSRPNSRGPQSRASASAKGSYNHGKQEQLVKQKHFEARPKSALANFTKRYTSGLVESKLPGLPSNVSKQDPAKRDKEMVHKPQRGRGPDSSLSPPLTRDRTDSTSSTPGRTMKSLSNELKTKLTRPRSRSRHGLEELEKDHQRLQVQVSHLNNEIERIQSMYLYCGRKLDSYIGLLQEEVTKDSESDRDVVYLSLAGLKQVRDLLKGTLSYRGSSLETEKDFIDIDKGIATRLQISSPNVGRKQIPNEIPVPLLGNDNHYRCTNSNENLITQSNATADQNLSLTGSDSQPIGHRGNENVTDEEKLSCNATTEYKQSSSEERSQSPGISHESATDKGSTDHCADQEFMESPQTNFSMPPETAVCSLDSNFEEHFRNSKEPLSITSISCTTGSSTDKLFNDSGYGNDLLSQVNDTATNRSEIIPKNASNISTPEETLDREFVFVNKDGTARSTEDSPRISPTHPLEINDDDDED